MGVQVYSEKADERGVGFKEGDGSKSKEDWGEGAERLKFGRPKSEFRGEGVVLAKSGRKGGGCSCPSCIFGRKGVLV